MKPDNIKVVSANYKDRKSPFKWLVRNEADSIANTQDFKLVIARNVQFMKSGQQERGFGCTMIALCATIEGYNEFYPEFDTSTFTKLEFDGRNFYFTKNRTLNAITKVAALYLDQFGSMWVLTVPNEISRQNQIN